MLRIAIDGACRRNGKPDCTASGGMFVQTYAGDTLLSTDIRACHEYNSTNQRGELLALLEALKYIMSTADDAQIITDSEYIFNAMTKVWYSKWAMNGWKTAGGDAVKNADLWKQIAEAKLQCYRLGLDIIFYHIKGHVIPFGTVTADNLLSADDTGMLLLKEVCKKYDASVITKAESLQRAQLLSIKNNGFALQPDILKSFVVSNVVVDAVATAEVDNADLARHNIGP